MVLHRNVFWCAPYERKEIWTTGEQMSFSIFCSLWFSGCVDYKMWKWGVSYAETWLFFCSSYLPCLQSHLPKSSHQASMFLLLLSLLELTGSWTEWLSVSAAQGCRALALHLRTCTSIFILKTFTANEVYLDLDQCNITIQIRQFFFQ